jgi:hypothetical protein
MNNYLIIIALLILYISTVKPCQDFSSFNLKNINYYLVIIAALVIFIGIKDKFTSVFTPVTSNIPDVQPKTTYVPLKQVPNVVDSRIKYSTLPPVAENVVSAVIKDTIPANPDLYYPGSYDSVYSSIDAPSDVENTNQLDYSGGKTQLIQIPLQYNDPYQPEQLRSQDILVTPYNKIKYGTKC